MKILLGTFDPDRRRVRRVLTVQEHEPLLFPHVASEWPMFVGTRLLMDRPGMIGHATLGKVSEPPSCFRFKPEIGDSPYLRRVLHLVADMAIGTVVRPVLTGAGRLRADGQPVQPEEWDLLVIGPH